MHSHFLTETGSISVHDTQGDAPFIVDMRQIKSERELLSLLGVTTWLELQWTRQKIAVTHWERLQRMCKPAAEALVYLANNCETELISCSRYPWVTFNTYSPSVFERKLSPKENSSINEDDPCLAVVRSMLKGLLGNVRTSFEQLQVHYDYEAKDSMQAFRKFQPHAAQYLMNLGSFPFALNTFTREERFMLYAAFIGQMNASKHDTLIFGSFSVKKRRLNRKNNANRKKAVVTVKEGRKWVGEERLLAIYYFITPVPPACLWLAKRIMAQLTEKRLLASQGGKKYKCLLGEHFIYSMASKLDSFELERYLYKV